MARKVVRLPNPHHGLKTVLEASQQSRFVYLAAGRRWRKTTGAMLRVVNAALSSGGNYIWGAPTHDQARIGMQETEKALGGYGTSNLSRMSIKLPSGATLFFRGLDRASNLRGLTANGAVVDEAGFVDGNAWYEVLRPMLIDTNGWALIMGTPNGMNWFYDEFGRAALSPDSATFTIPTVGCEIVGDTLVRKPHPLENPDIPYEEIETIFKQVSRHTFRQELMAEFLSSSGTVFRNVSRLAKPPSQDGPIDGHTYVAGIDTALVDDFTAIVVIDTFVTPPHVVAVERFNQVDYTYQVERVYNTLRRWKVDAAVIERNNADLFIELLDARYEAERLSAVTVPFTTSFATKGRLIENLSAAFDNGEIALLNDPDLLRELAAYSYKTQTSFTTRIKYSALPGLHDDLVMALALAWHGVEDATSTVGVIQYA